MNARIAAITWVALCATPVFAQSTIFTYQGDLKDSGQPADGLHDFRFTLFSAASGGVPVGSAVCLNNVGVADGLFTVELDFGQQFTGTAARHLEIEVRSDTGLDCSNLTGFVMLSARQQITAAPRAMSALAADNSSQLGGQASAFYRNATNINAGTLADARLSSNVALLSGAQTFTGAKTFSAGLTTSAFTLAPGAGLGKVLTSDAAGAASWQDAGSVLPWGVNGNDIFNTNTGNVGIGTLAPTHSLHIANAQPTLALQDTDSTTQQVGYVSYRDSGNVERAWVGYGSAGDPDFSIVNARPGGDIVLVNFGGGGVGIGTASPTAPLNVRAVGGNTVLAQQTAASGFAAGLRAENSSSGGFGVQAVNLGIGGAPIAVEGFDNVNASGIGVYGFVGSPGAGSRKAVFGECLNTPGHAVYSAGNFAATGTKSFCIDHPDDPENKYLLHYCPESPEVLNFYSGTAILNDTGEAIVELPAYFARINRDPRYTLTAVGAAMPALHIAREIDSNALAAGASAQPGRQVPRCVFQIAGGVAAGKVCWRVEAVRNDAWVQQHGAPVEVEKLAHERGKYQHPDLYGQPREKGMYPGGKRGPDGRPLTPGE